MLDELDLKLIAELRKDGRQSYTALAEKLEVTEGTIRNRVKGLLGDNILQIVAVSNPFEIGYNFISIMGLQVRVADLRPVADTLSAKPNVCYLAFVTGRYDLIAMVITRTSQELSNFIENEVSVIPGVLRTETFINLDIIKGEWPAALDIVELIRSTSLSTPGRTNKSTGH